MDMKKIAKLFIDILILLTSMLSPFVIAMFPVVIQTVTGNDGWLFLMIPSVIFGVIMMMYTWPGSKYYDWLNRYMEQNDFIYLETDVNNEDINDINEFIEEYED